MQFFGKRLTFQYVIQSQPPRQDLKIVMRHIIIHHGSSAPAMFTTRLLVSRSAASTARSARANNMLLRPRWLMSSGFYSRHTLVPAARFPMSRTVVSLHRNSLLLRLKTPKIRLNSSTTANATTQQLKPSSTSRWHRVAVVIRYVRIPVVVVSVYSLGYQQGVIDCTKEPVALQNQILNSILVSTGCKSVDDVHIVSEKDISWHSTARHHQVAAVGHKIVSTARKYVENKLEGAMQHVKQKLPPDISPETQLRAMEADSNVQFWYQARLRLEGEAVIKQPWQYIFIESAAPNAFVTEILPRRFFITTAMLKVAETPDELAVVLGHEVSHLILGHVSDTNKVETALRTVEVLLLSMDPTAGLLSVFVIGLIYAARRAVSAAYSRDNELQADDLGLQLAASACYDTAAGSKVMYKMHQAATGMASSTDTKRGAAVKVDADTSGDSTAGTVVRLMDTHPPSLDRWERMQRAAAEGENYTKYDDCAGISSRFFNALWGSTERKGNETKPK
jgi:Zn-dependent protease with chaperone function